ncbi:MAG: hypothetical protein ACT4OV_13895 [Microthrixaceae bacterium]
MGQPDTLEIEGRAALRATVLTLVGLTVAVVILAIAQGGPAYFLQLGDESPGLPKAREVLGADVPTPLADGHDGDRFWQLARDPLLRDDGSLAKFLDRPVYRAQRIGYPALAAPWHLAGEGALLWGMVATNIAVIGLGTYVVGRWSAERGGPGRLGFAFAFNPLSIYALIFDLGDAVALTGLVTAVYLFRRRPGTAMVLAATIGVLAKEPTVAGLAAVAVLSEHRSLRDRSLLLVPAAVAAASWRMYVLSRPAFSRYAEVEEFTTVPFAGFIDSWRFGWWPEGRWPQASLSLGLLAVALVCIVLWLRDRRCVELVAALPFALITPFLSAQVVSLWHNTVRATGPALLFLTMHLVLRARSPRTVPAAAT